MYSLPYLSFWFFYEVNNVKHFLWYCKCEFLTFFSKFPSSFFCYEGTFQRKPEIRFKRFVEQKVWLTSISRSWRYFWGRSQKLRFTPIRVWCLSLLFTPTEMIAGIKNFNLAEVSVEDLSKLKLYRGKKYEEMWV